jgi:hypothetical protein
MSIAKSLTVALSVAAFSTTLLTGTAAYAADHPVARHGISHSQASLQTTQRVAAGSTVPGEGWEQSGTGSLKIHVDTTSAHFTGIPVYVTSVAGAGNHFALTGTSAVYLPTVTGFDIFVRWANGAPITPADAVSGGWYVHWVGVDNP